VIQECGGPQRQDLWGGRRFARAGYNALAPDLYKGAYHGAGQANT